MPTTVRFLQPSSFLLAKSATKLINGDTTGRYPSCPPLVEDPNYPMSNLLKYDRNIPWVHPGGGGQVDVEFDLGSNQSVSVLGLLAMMPAPGGLLPSGGCTFMYKAGNSTSPLFGYDVNAFTDLFTSGGHLSLSGNPRERVNHETFGTVSARYWRARFKAPITSSFSIGSIVVGSAPIDIGTPTYFGQDSLYSPGSMQETLRARVVSRTLGGVAIQTDIGLPRRRFRYRYEAVNRATRDILRSVAIFFARINDQLLLTPENEAYTIMFPDDGFQEEHIWGSTAADALYNVEIVMESQP